jgi:hypothetical protein
VSINTPPAIETPGDFAAGERTEAQTPEEILEDGFQGDFAAGERTEPLTPEEVRDEGLHGDFAVGERTELPTSEEETPGSFADIAK